MKLKLLKTVGLFFFATSAFAQGSAGTGTKDEELQQPTQQAAQPQSSLGVQAAQWSPSVVVSFGVANTGGVQQYVPKWADKWVEKNAKKFPVIRFSQTPNVGAANYLVVFSTSADQLSGFDPVVRTDISTSTTPVSGSGTVTDYYGGRWDFTYTGTETTTTTTTTHENIPYTIDSNTLYASVYDGQGKLVSRHWRTVSTKEGGDPYNTLGYNIGAALSTIHLKSGLLHDAVQDIAAKAEFDPGGAAAADTACQKKRPGKYVTVSGKKSTCYIGMDGKMYASR